MSANFPKESPFSIHRGVSILDRTPLQVQNAPLSEIQLEVEGLVASALSTVSDEKMMASLFGAGLAGRLVRLGTGAALGKALAPWAVQGASHALALAGESAVFAGMERGFGHLDGQTPSHGLGKDWARAFINLGSIKLLGGAARGQNLITQHLLIDTGMVAGHHADYALHVVDKPQGSLAQQMIQAEGMNLGMKGSLALLHGFSPRLSAMEKSLDVALKSEEADRTGLEKNFLHFPLPAVAMAGRSEGGSSTTLKPSPLIEQNLMKISGKERDEKGPSPKLAVPLRDNPGVRPAAPLTESDRFFLQKNLLDLEAENGLIPISLREACRSSLEAALRGDIPILDAAALLVKGHQDNLILNLKQGLFTPDGRPIDFIERIDRYPLKELGGRLKDLPPELQRLLSETSGDLEVAEVTSNYDNDANIAVQKVKNQVRVSYDAPIITTLYRLGGMREFHQAFIHPKGSRTWRFLPLQFLIGGIALTGGKNAVGIQWTAAPSTLDGMRDMIAQSKKPVCVGSKPSLPWQLQDAPGITGLDKPAFCRAHDEIYDAYRMLIHDLCHVIEWNELSPKQRSDEVLLNDSLMKTLNESPPEVRTWAVFSDIRDSLFSYYFGEGRASEMIEASLRHAAQEDAKIDRALITPFMETFRRRLDENLQGHPRRIPILGH